MAAAITRMLALVAGNPVSLRDLVKNCRARKEPKFADGNLDHLSPFG
ncbi:hypothetical protein [Rhizobium ruizarguesonis]|nr:hypothetical protein [Rhizobium ruizarguesonis]